MRTGMSGGSLYARGLARRRDVSFEVVGGDSRRGSGASKKGVERGDTTTPRMGSPAPIRHDDELTYSALSVSVPRSSGSRVESADAFDDLDELVEAVAL
jgi:hypothetical protein